MKKIFSLLLAGALGFGFVSCQKDTPKTQTEEQTPKGYSIVGGSWYYALKDGDFTQALRFAFRVDGTYEFRYYRITTSEEHKNDLDSEFNDELIYSGRYTYADGRVTILTTKFVGYGERFAERRKQENRQPSEPEDGKLNGLVLLVDEKAETMTISRTLSSPNIEITDEPLEKPFIREK